MPALIEGWRAGEWAWAILALAQLICALLIWLWDLRRGWTPRRMWREFYHEAKQSRAEKRPRRTVYEFGPTFGLAFTLLIAAGFVFCVGTLNWFR